MATIATGSIAERTHTQTYIFFSFLTAGFIFPFGLAWVYNDGWLMNLGFEDNGGAAVVHLMGGLAGFMGTYLIGPRIGRFSTDKELAFVLDDEGITNEELNEAIEKLMDNKKNKQVKE